MSTARERLLERNIAALREMLSEPRADYRELRAEAKGMAERLAEHERRAAPLDSCGLGSSLTIVAAAPRRGATPMGDGCYRRTALQPNGGHR